MMNTKKGGGGSALSLEGPHDDELPQLGMMMKPDQVTPIGYDDETGLASR
jgi:hypothetical protein